MQQITVCDFLQATGHDINIHAGFHIFIMHREK
jgi:hypothetical protein